MKPILFNSEMVRAILDGRKFVTRRVVKVRFRPDECLWNIVSERHTGKFSYIEICDEWETETRRVYGPYQPGDILYVRETWAEVARKTPKANQLYAEVFYAYRADGEHELVKKWRPSIHMPREAARLFLRVTDVRIERLQEIECIATEGITMIPCDAKLDARFHFIQLWDSTIKPDDRDRYGWDANPWVWVIEFEQISKEDAYGSEKRPA